MIKVIVKYIFNGLMWCIIYTTVNLIKNQNVFINFMHTKNYLYELLIYSLASIVVTFLFDLKASHKHNKSSV